MPKFFRKTIVIAQLSVVSLITSPSLFAIPTQTNVETLAFNAHNRATVTLDVCFAECQPDDATACANKCVTIDNILLDTGSLGLRLNSSAANLAQNKGTISNLKQLNLPRVPGPTSGRTMVNVVSYGEYYLGHVVKADVFLHNSKLRAKGVNLAVVTATDFKGFNSEIPGFNGVLGLDIRPSSFNMYAECVPSTVPIDPSDLKFCNSLDDAPVGADLQNMVAQMDANLNKGYLITVPSIPAEGAAAFAPGETATITFGIGTMSNNTPSAQVKATAVSPNNMYIQFPPSPARHTALVDSGATTFPISAQQFNKDLTLCSFAVCSRNGRYTTQGFYVNVGDKTSQNLFSTTGVFVDGNYVDKNLKNLMNGFEINLDPKGVNILGMPFFYGRTIYFQLSNVATDSFGQGPLVAFQQNASSVCLTPCLNTAQ